MARRAIQTHSEPLERDAYLYIRQSSMKQVVENVESTKRQYALRERVCGDGLLHEATINAVTTLSRRRDESAQSELVDVPRFPQGSWR